MSPEEFKEKFEEVLKLSEEDKKEIEEEEEKYMASLSRIERFFYKRGLEICRDHVILIPRLSTEVVNEDLVLHYGFWIYRGISGITINNKWLLKTLKKVLHNIG
jgi:hypothetical protein